MIKKMKKTVACSECGKHLTCEGKPGEKVVITCEDCGAKGFVLFQKHKKEKKERKPFSIKTTKGRLVAYSIVIVLFLLLLFVVFIPTIQGDLHFLTVLSGSMEPDIHPGDIVVSGKVDPSTIKAGDVITFRYDDEKDPNRCITHRVIEVIEGQNGIGFKTKGDANEEAEPRTVKPSEVIGRVSLVLPSLGYLANFARSQEGFVLFILIPAILIIVNEVFRINKIRKEEKSEKVKK